MAVVLHYIFTFINIVKRKVLMGAVGVMSPNSSILDYGFILVQQVLSFFDQLIMVFAGIP